MPGFQADESAVGGVTDVITVVDTRCEYLAATTVDY